ncbi:Lsr2 family DNA-binding protein [Micromonospora sp. NBC_00389]|uniref:Lsr2 family DNA-binding protein n=1 Tax=Micromonospora sp. NBC_00389 TaxID=2903586 RepID=UPI003FA593AA
MKSQNAERDRRRIIREWWTKNEKLVGQKATERGRIPATVIDAYRQHETLVSPATSRSSGVIPAATGSAPGV